LIAGRLTISGRFYDESRTIRAVQRRYGMPNLPMASAMNRKSKRALAKPEADAMLRDLADGASKVFQNAADLYHEASALHAVGALSRALFLHQISLEECAKIEMLGAWAVSVLTGKETDVQKLTVAFASHKAKNYTNAYLLPVANAESDARQEKRWHDAIEAFEQQKAQFHLESNSAKNASLYVDVQSGTFTAPKDRITESMVGKIAQANEEFLVGAQTKVEMMTRWLNNLDKARDLVKWFETRSKELMSQSNDPEEAIFVIMDEMLTRAKETGYYEAMTDGERVAGERDKADK
jgi:AbiV family abortive infection protein